MSPDPPPVAHGAALRRAVLLIMREPAARYQDGTPWEGSPWEPARLALLLVGHGDPGPGYYPGLEPAPSRWEPPGTPAERELLAGVESALSDLVAEGLGFHVDVLDDVDEVLGTGVALTAAGRESAARAAAGRTDPPA